MRAGGSYPNSLRAVGAMSSIPGASAPKSRLQNSTPGICGGSTQWSPLHALVLSSKTGPETLPSATPRELR